MKLVLYLFLILSVSASAIAQTDTLSQKKYQKELKSIQYQNRILLDSIRSLDKLVKSEQRALDSFQMNVNNSLKQLASEDEENAKMIQMQKNTIGDVELAQKTQRPYVYSSLLFAIIALFGVFLLLYRIRRLKEEKEHFAESMMQWRRLFEDQLRMESEQRNLLRAEWLMELNNLLAENVRSQEVKDQEAFIRIVNLLEARLLNVFDRLDHDYSKLESTFKESLKKRGKKWKSEMEDLEETVKDVRKKSKLEIKELEKQLKKTVKTLETMQNSQAMKLITKKKKLS